MVLIIAGLVTDSLLTEEKMKLSRKKFFVSLGAVVIAGTAVLSNPVKLLFNKKSNVNKINIKENPNAVKRNSTGAVNG